MAINTDRRRVYFEGFNNLSNEVVINSLRVRVSFTPHVVVLGPYCQFTLHVLAAYCVFFTVAPDTAYIKVRQFLLFRRRYCVCSRGIQQPCTIHFDPHGGPNPDMIRVHNLARVGFVYMFAHRPFLIARP